MAIAHLATRDKGKAKAAPLKVLFDTGGSHCMISEQHVKKLTKTKVAGQEWSTPAGKMSTHSAINGKFMLPEFHDGQCVQWKLHITKNLGAYDMIIG